MESTMTLSSIRQQFDFVAMLDGDPNPAERIEVPFEPRESECLCACGVRSCTASYDRNGDPAATR